MGRLNMKYRKKMNKEQKKKQLMELRVKHGGSVPIAYINAVLDMMEEVYVQGWRDSQEPISFDHSGYKNINIDNWV